MNETPPPPPHMPDLDPTLNSQAVSLYGQSDAMDDFPVLKAFQQYIDTEQAKARKRLVSLGIFFGILMGAVIAVFLVMLMKISERNQTLNDRLIEFAMKERAQQQGPVVVQPPVQQDNSAILSLTAKLENMQKQLMDSQKRAEAAEREKKEAAEAAEAALRPKTPSAQELEIERLKVLLNKEKEQAAAEKAKLREAELEAYRRKHYPECYEQPKRPLLRNPVRKPIVLDDEEDEDDLDEIEEPVVRRKRAIKYFDEEEDEDEEDEVKTVVKQAEKKNEKKSPIATPSPEPAPKAYTIPVDVKGKTSSWRLP